MNNMLRASYFAHKTNCCSIWALVYLPSAPVVIRLVQYKEYKHVKTHTQSQCQLRPPKMRHGQKMNRIFLLSSAVFLLPCESELIFIYCVPRILISSLRELVSCSRKIQKSDWLYFILLTTDGKCLQNITHLLLAKIAVMLVTTSYKSSFDRSRDGQDHF